jgi:hypothetical protein
MPEPSGPGGTTTPAGDGPGAEQQPEAARTVSIGGGAALRCLVCGSGSFWRRHPKAVHRTDQVLMLAKKAGRPRFRDPSQSWPGFAEVCASCGFVHWFSSEATKRRPEPG